MMLNTPRDQANPFISIIITTLNGGKTIEQCLKSIASQSFKSFELVIVDAGSSDETLAIINTYRHVVTKLEVIPKIGLYAGLNEGIRLAAGKWLYFMGCDDRLADSSTLQFVSDKITTAPKDVKVVAGSVRYQNSYYVMEPLLGSPYMMRFRLHHQGTFYHHTLFTDRLYNEKLRISADYEFNLRLGLEQASILPLNIPIAIYGEEGISSKKYLNNINEIQQVNANVFKGFARTWVLSYNYILTRIWLFRHRTGLLNLKQKTSSFIANLKSKTSLLF